MRTDPKRKRAQAPPHPRDARSDGEPENDQHTSLTEFQLWRN